MKVSKLPPLSPSSQKIQFNIHPFLSTCTLGDAPSIAIEDGKVVVCGVHTDSTILTLLETFHYPGLEVLGENGTWLAVKPHPGTLVVNIGDMLAQFTGGRLKATKHRVVDLGKDRYSVPFFLEPNYHANIGKPPISQHLTACEKYMPQGVNKDGSECKYGHWLVETYKKKKYVEFLDFEMPRLWFEQLFVSTINTGKES